MKGLHVGSAYLTWASYVRVEIMPEGRTFIVSDVPWPRYA